MRLEGVVHQQALNVGRKLLAAALRGLYDDLQQQGTLALAVVIVVQAYAGGEGTQGCQASHEAGELAVGGSTAYNFPDDGREVLVP